MRIVISSKVLANALERIYPKDMVYCATVRNSKLILQTANDINISIIVEAAKDFDTRAAEGEVMAQIDNRWDWVYDLVRRVQDQPIVLEIGQKKVNVIFQY